MTAPVSALPEIPSSDLDTLYSAFARRQSSERPEHAYGETDEQRRNRNRRLLRELRNISCREPSPDLRSLEYAADYEPHLMCPICHTPMINPITLECDHHFCAKCFVQSCDRVIQDDEGPQCPSCRTPIKTKPRKASRLVSNMCDNVRVHCSNDGCDEVLPRSHIPYHSREACGEQQVSCSCNAKMRRKNHIVGKCLHATHTECKCGKLVELGSEKQRAHKEEECPEAGDRCKKCNERLPDATYLVGSTHDCGVSKKPCPGEEYGCEGCAANESVEDHMKHCVIAKLAPSMKAQAALLDRVKGELAWTKTRNEIVESALDRMCDQMSFEPLADLPSWSPLGPEDSMRSVVSQRTQRQDVRAPRLPLIPATGRFAIEDSQGTDTERGRLQSEIESGSPASPNPTSQQHLLALHESLRISLNNVQSEVSSLSASIADVDARNSMHIMNETLRIKEDLAHTNAALITTRSQVEWLVNRERARQQMSMRGRAAGTAANVAGSSGSAPAVTSTSMARGSSSEGETSTAAEAVLGNRSVARRQSGGSQERVKL